MADVRQCELCGCPLGQCVHLWIQIHWNGMATSHFVCAADDAMLRAAATTWFDRCEREYNAEVERIQGLKSGGNYLA